MDFYTILGIDQNASPAEIERAYRRLSRRYHPGINPGDRSAEAMFRRVAEAYETLSDPALRRQYDAAGRSTPQNGTQTTTTLQFTEFDFSASARGAQAATFSELFAEVLHPVPGRGGRRQEAGADIHATIAVEFIDAIRGIERQVVVTRQVPCITCRGTGHTAAVEARCAPCKGTGAVRWARGHMVFSKTCPACDGSGRQTMQRCGACHGSCRTVRGEAVAVVVPPGTADGARLRVPEQGHAGYHGGRTGDLYVTVNVHPHPFLRREGDTLVCIVPLAVHEAVLGARIQVPTLDGPVKLAVAPGTHNGQRFRLAGRGIATQSGARGDLVVEVKLVLPERVDERSKELIREFGQRNQGDVRKDLAV
jgi:molecular chaperone DnaJ